MKRGRGKPTKYRKNFHNEDFIRLSKQGKSFSQIASEWDIHRGTLYDWAVRHTQFADTLKKGRDFCEAWYINLGQQAMLGQATMNGQKVKVDIGLYVWLTKNMFRWGDKGKPEKVKVLGHDPLSHLSDEELEALDLEDCEKQ